MTTPAHSRRGTASDSLLVQVHAGNVLQVRNTLLQQQEDIKAVLLQTRTDLRLRQLGQDPISQDATPMFQAKIDQIVRVHWDHVRELSEATDRLREAALHYGHTDDEIDAAFAAHSREVGPLVVDR